MNKLLKNIITINILIAFTAFAGLPVQAFSGKEDAHQHNESERTEDSLKNQVRDSEHEHDHGEVEEDKAPTTTLSPRQLGLANIKVKQLNPRNIDYQLYAPGFIKTNGYTSYLVSPRVDSVVLRRHVALGDHVTKDQPLVTLFSKDVAQAQATHSVAWYEWQRVQKLGRKTVGDKRYITAKNQYSADHSRLIAFGLSDFAIKSSLKNTTRLGEYTLYAAKDGVVLSDKFSQGQHLDAGDSLIELADEHQLWVEASLSATEQIKLPTGTLAGVKVAGKTFDARVIQQAHTIDPQTRTRTVRLLVNNEQHLLHPGMFADVYFLFTTDTPVIAVPEEALIRGSDGDWTVFVENESGEFNVREVELGRNLGKWREIQGIAAGSRVVVSGAFFVASQIAKSGFDPHNH